MLLNTKVKVIERAITINKEIKQGTNIETGANRIKSDNFTRSNREFVCTNNIFASTRLS